MENRRVTSQRIKNKSIIFEILHAISPNLYTSPIKSSKNVINDAIIKIENNIFASILKFKEKEYFKVSDEDKKRVDVKL